MLALAVIALDAVVTGGVGLAMGSATAIYAAAPKLGAGAIIVRILVSR